MLHGSSPTPFDYRVGPGYLDGVSPPPVNLMNRLRFSLLSLASAILLQTCGAQTLKLPPRPVDAPSRDDILRVITPLPRQEREDSIFSQIMRGNVPEFMRTLVAVTSSASIGGTVHSVTYYVTPDYLAVGPDERYFLTPMTPLLAQRLADTLKCILPTRKMVNDIYASASLKLAPAPIPPSAEMITVPVFAQHDSIVWTQRESQLGPSPLGTLVGGTKKDVVISNRIRNNLKPGVPKPVVIYGWHQLNGVPIQPLYNGHGETYADYSHGIRLVQETVQLDGSSTTVSAILKDNVLAPILSDEGAIPIPRYGDPPTGVTTDSAGEPQGSMIFQNYPNPFNPSTTIKFGLPKASHVTLTVYNTLGQIVREVVNGEMEAGYHEVQCDATGLASGVYLYRMTAGHYAGTRKLMVLR